MFVLVEVMVVVAPVELGLKPSSTITAVTDDDMRAATMIIAARLVLCDYPAPLNESTVLPSKSPSIPVTWPELPDGLFSEFPR